ncbi:sulfite exporter TauE/SafE family protein [Yimella sp. cx-573]|nr:sulfite exporter TauE/SafE family protein [Yimella sp. cx-573]
MGISWTLFVVLGLFVALGSFVQRVIGFGLAVVAAPFIVMAAPDLMPVSLLITVLPLPLLEVIRGRADVLWRSFSWAMLGRLLTMPLGVWLVSVASSTTISVVVACMVLVAVAGSFARVRVQPTGPLSLFAGLITGVSATAASIGGPFYSLVLQNQKPQQVRATLAPFFLIGALTSLAGLAIGGQVHSDAIIAGLAWMPFMLLGSLVAQPLRHRIHPARFRQFMLVLATVAALAVFVRVATQ